MGEGHNYLVVCDQLGGTRGGGGAREFAMGIREVASGRREEFHRASVEMYEQDRRGDEIHQARPYLLTLGRRR